MPPSLEYMVMPFICALILTSLLTYLGIHVIARGVIFVDLALAQIAALGATVGFLYGKDIHDPISYAFSVGFTLIGAGIFSVTRSKQDRFPQEAIIGITYAVATAAVILIVDKAPHGADHIRELLQGNIVWTAKEDIFRLAGVFIAVGTLQVIFRKQFLCQSGLQSNGTTQGGINRRWDFLFYATFGFAIVSAVQIAGVLLVFSYLVVPALASLLFTNRLKSRLLIGWTVSAAISFIGLLFSYDRPSGPMIVVLFGSVLILLGLIHGLRRKEYSK